jgi:hypothetical protein
VPRDGTFHNQADPRGCYDRRLAVRGAGGEDDVPVLQPLGALKCNLLSAALAALMRFVFSSTLNVMTGDLLCVTLQAHFLRHQSQQKIDIDALTQQKGKFTLLKRRKEPFRKFFPFDRHNADGRIFRNAAAEYRHQCLPGESAQRGGGSRTRTKIEGGRDIRDPGEMDGLVVMSAGDIYQQLFRRCAGNGFVIRHDRPVERDGRYTPESTSRAARHGSKRSKHRGLKMIMS